MPDQMNITVCGETFSLATTNDEDYVRKLAEYVDTRLNEITRARGGAFLSPTLRTALLALNIADDYFKAAMKNAESSMSDNPEMSDELVRGLRKRAAEAEAELAQMREKSAETGKKLSIVTAQKRDLEKIFAEQGAIKNDFEKKLGLERGRAADLQNSLNRETEQKMELKKLLSLETSKKYEYEKALNIEREEWDETEKRLNLEVLKLSETVTKLRDRSVLLENELKLAAEKIGGLKTDLTSRNIEHSRLSDKLDAAQRQAADLNEQLSIEVELKQEAEEGLVVLAETEGRLAAELRKNETLLDQQKEAAVKTGKLEFETNELKKMLKVESAMRQEAQKQADELEEQLREAERKLVIALAVPELDPVIINSGRHKAISEKANTDRITTEEQKAYSGRQNILNVSPELSGVPPANPLPEFKLSDVLPAKDSAQTDEPPVLQQLDFQDSVNTDKSVGDTKKMSVAGLFGGSKLNRQERRRMGLTRK